MELKRLESIGDDCNNISLFFWFSTLSKNHSELRQSNLYNTKIVQPNFFMLFCAEEPSLSLCTWEVPGRMLEKFLEIDDDSVFIFYVRRNDENLCAESAWEKRRYQETGKIRRMENRKIQLLFTVLQRWLKVWLQ